jgi:class 3 adenylate cyclase
MFQPSCHDAWLASGWLYRSASACGTIAPMARLQSRPIGSPDEVRQMPNGILEIYNLDDLVFGRTEFQPGWQWSKDVKAIAGTELCQYHHIGYAISGLLRVEMADGTTAEIGANQVFEIPAGHDAWVIGDEPWVTIDVNGMRSYGRIDEGAQRVLGAILFTDIVDSTSTAGRLGPTRWRELLQAHQQDVQIQLDRYRGRLIKSTGDGFLALFDGSERAVRAALAIATTARNLGVEIRAGVHTGEVEIVASDLAGVAVHVAARVMALAGPGEVLVSGTTHELVTGTGLAFEDAGMHELKGIPGTRQLYRVSTPG